MAFPDNYAKKLQAEINHYRDIFKNRRQQDVPPIWYKVESYFANSINEAIGVNNLYQYVANHVKNKNRISILGLGSGACGNELDGIAPLLSCDIELFCVDINTEILNQAQEVATRRGINFSGITQDINKIQLEPNSFDVIVAYASLHHFIELYHIARQINKALRPDGIFVTVDIPTRNGYLMWDETYDIVKSIWKSLPPKFKIAHTGFATPTYTELFPNVDYSVNSFECINSEEIIPALRKNLREVAYVPALSISRRFFDTKYGPNYDIEDPFDMSVFNFITNLDTYYIKSGILKPETFFGAYTKT